MTPPRPARPLFFLDYDGTLAPIVADPAEARPHPEVPALLERLAARYPVYVVTGRHLAAVAELLPLPLPAIGLHGAQEGRLGEPPRDALPADAAEALDRMRESVPAHDGLWVEPKGPSFAVHYRHAADAAAALDVLRDWAGEAPEALEAVWGKQVVELRPRGTSKGVAVRRVAAGHPERTPVYLGDDVTDEDAFAALGDDAVTVKVGAGPTVARFRLPDVDAVVAYLRGFVEEPKR